MARYWQFIKSIVLVSQCLFLAQFQVNAQVTSSNLKKERQATSVCEHAAQFVGGLLSETKNLGDLMSKTFPEGQIRKEYAEVNKIELNEKTPTFKVSGSTILFPAFKATLDFSSCESDVLLVNGVEILVGEMGPFELSSKIDEALEATKGKKTSGAGSPIDLFKYGMSVLPEMAPLLLLFPETGRSAWYSPATTWLTGAATAGLTMVKGVTLAGAAKVAGVATVAGGAAYQGYKMWNCKSYSNQILRAYRQSACKDSKDGKPRYRFKNLKCPSFGVIGDVAQGYTGIGQEPELEIDRIVTPSETKTNKKGQKYKTEQQEGTVTIAYGYKRLFSGPTMRVTKSQLIKGRSVIDMTQREHKDYVTKDSLGIQPNGELDPKTMAPLANRAKLKHLEIYSPLVKALADTKYCSYCDSNELVNAMRGFSNCNDSIDTSAPLSNIQ